MKRERGEAKHHHIITYFLFYVMLLANGCFRMQRIYDCYCTGDQFQCSVGYHNYKVTCTLNCEKKQCDNEIGTD